MYLFLMQMAQLPLILVGRASVFKRHPGLGNVSEPSLLAQIPIAANTVVDLLRQQQIFFWVGLMSGFPLLAVGYLKF